MVRFKNRYLLCRIDCEPHVSAELYKVEPRELYNAIRFSLSRNFGDLAIAKVASSLSIKTWSPALSLCLVRCARDHFRTVWGSITLLSTLQPVCDVGPVRFTVIHVGGTIRSCSQCAIDQARQLILDAQTSGGDPKPLEHASTSMQRQMEDPDGW